jgi:hypothetical protein
VSWLRLTYNNGFGKTTLEYGTEIINTPTPTTLKTVSLGTSKRENGRRMGYSHRYLKDPLQEILSLFNSRWAEPA